MNIVISVDGIEKQTTPLRRHWRILGLGDVANDLESVGQLH